MGEKLTVGSLFSGIGGLDLGLERAGMDVRWQCEIDPYCQSILRRHWPAATLYGDIHELGLEAERVDLICGGFPCQPVSLAGKGLAQEDPRWLWPEFARVVGLLRPRYVIVENVPGLAKRGLGDVITGLAEMGYDAEWQVVSAASVGAPHLRERLFIVAYGSSPRRREDAGSPRSDEAPHGRWTGEDHLSHGDGEGDRAGQVPGDVADSSRDVRRQQAQTRPLGERARESRTQEEEGEALADADRPGLGELRWAGATREKLLAAQRLSQWLPESEVGRVAHGVPGRVAQLRALGNAVVPQVSELVGRLIVEREAAA